MADNTLYYGDNLDVLRRHVADESVDLVYLDPPFNSNADYNVLFAQQDGTAAAAQIQAFEDTWRWDMAAARALDEMVRRGGRVADTLLALQRILGDSDMMAYLAMMAPRLVELCRALKDTGSLYLHCDPTASHYLKIILDAVFGPENFRSEIIWRRTSGHNKVSRQYGPIHDTLLFYAKTDGFHFWPGVTPPARGYIKEWFTGEDERGPYRTNTQLRPVERLQRLRHLLTFDLGELLLSRLLILGQIELPYGQLSCPVGIDTGEEIGCERPRSAAVGLLRYLGSLLVFDLPVEPCQPRR